MANYFSDNKDVQFHFQHLDIDEVIGLKEDGFKGDGNAADLAAAKKAYQDKLELIGQIAAERIAPRAAEIDRVECSCRAHQVTIPIGMKDNLEDLKNAGVTAVTLPRQYGGLNFPTTIYSMMTEMVSRADASLQNLFGLQSIAETVRQFGSEEQKARVLPPFARGEWNGAMALTEPEAGSDLQSVQMTAKLDENGVWRLNGLKHFITNGIAEMLLVLARSEEGTRDARGLSMFIVHPCPELVVNRIEDKMGMHGSPTCELQFNNVPAELVGKRRFGLTRYVMSLMNGARLAISAQSVGIAEASRQAAWEYCSQRKQFGKTLAEIGPVHEMLTRMDALTAASRALLYETCKWVDLRDAWNFEAEAHPENEEAPAKSKEAAKVADALTPMTKAFNTESANQCAYDSIQCHGGKGYMRERPIERYYRDARIMNIYEGTTQMQVVAATAGILKGSVEPLFDELEAYPYSAAAMPLFQKVKAERVHTKAATEALGAATDLQAYLARRMVRANTIVFAALLLLKEGTVDESRLETARRFIWEFLPEAKMHSEVIMDTISEGEKQ